MSLVSLDFRFPSLSALEILPAEVSGRLRKYSICRPGSGEARKLVDHSRNLTRELLGLPVSPETHFLGCVS